MNPSILRRGVLCKDYGSCVSLHDSPHGVHTHVWYNYVNGLQSFKGALKDTDKKMSFFIFLKHCHSSKVNLKDYTPFFW